LVHIGMLAFDSAPITHMWIPNSCTEIGWSAFNSIVNSASTSVTMPSLWNNKPEKDNMFGGDTKWDQISFTWT